MCFRTYHLNMWLHHSTVVIARKLLPILNRYGICITALKLLMGNILRWKILCSLVPYGIITKGFFMVLLAIIRCSLQLCSNRCWTIWEQQCFWRFLFGILVSRWRILQKPIEGTPERIEKIVLATIALHNYLNQTGNAHYTPAGFIDSQDSTGEIIAGQWRKNLTNNLQEIGPVRNSRYQGNSLEVRETFAEYLISKNGFVSWQWYYIRQTGRE